MSFSENLLPIRVFDLEPGVSRKTSRHEVIYRDGRVRIKMLSDAEAARWADMGLKVRKLKKGER